MRMLPWIKMVSGGLRLGDCGDKEDCAECEGFHEWSVAGFMTARMAPPPPAGILCKVSKHKG